MGLGHEWVPFSRALDNCSVVFFPVYHIIRINTIRTFTALCFILDMYQEAIATNCLMSAKAYAKAN